MPFGAEILADGVRFRLWAPGHAAIGLKLEDTKPLHPMTALGAGWHELRLPGAGHGTRYRFVLPGGMEVPDPASRFQPEDVHGPSEVVDPAAHAWACPEWGGRAWEELVLYELHVGAFTPEGTFRAAAERLDFLRDLGVNAIELMPVADFPGRWNWGYDGVLLFAPDASYGRPEDFKSFIDAAHARGISVILDVVYNHFGPDGNYLPSYAPLFTRSHHTPWGAAVNYDQEGSDGVRRLVAENAAYWIGEYHLDGLRLDAVHAMIDDSPRHVLEDIAAAAIRAGGDRPIHLVLENEGNEASRLARDHAGRTVQFTAQWADDIHHVLHAAASGERAGYYADYAGHTDRLGRALAQGFAFQGEMMPYLGRPRGEPSAHLPPQAFVSFIQNHDQVGNRALGERLGAVAPAPAVRAVAAIYLLAPPIPMLFMGEEWGAAEPFPFFCDLGPDLANAVREGRRAEFARFPAFQDPAQQERIPDPTAPETFLSAKLRWEDAESGAHGAWLDWYRRVLAVRFAEIIPRLAGRAGHGGHYQILGDRAVRIDWRLGDGSRLALVANLKADALSFVAQPPGAILWSEGSSGQGELGPWSVVWTLVPGGGR